MPAAEHSVDFDQLRLLLRDQFPALAERRLDVLAYGWDNTLIRLGTDLLIRLPRREAAARLIEHEQRWLPTLAPRLPLPIPEPLYAGRPGRHYPWSWSIVAYREGENAADAKRLDTHHAAYTLGDFLAHLHVAAPADAPRNPFRGVALRSREAAFRANLELAGDAIDPSAAESIWEAALEARPWRHAPVWVHGDLHPANLLVAHTRLAAIIDFGDITSGDPATDLAIAWLLLPQQDRSTFWSAYRTNAVHDVDVDLKARARGWALTLATVFLARSANNPIMHQIGKSAATQVFEAS